MNIDNPEALTKEEILSPDITEALFEIEDLRERALMKSRISERAKALHIKTQFEELCKAAKRQIKEYRAAGLSVRTGQEPQKPMDNNEFQYQDNDGNMQTCFTGKYIVSKAGIYFYQGRQLVTVSRYPVIITARLINRDDNREKVVLTYWKGAERRSVSVKKGVASSSGKIVSLADIGFPVTSETARQLVSYLTDFEFFNDIPCRSYSSKYGWSGKEFVPYSKKIIFDDEAGLSSLVNSVKSAGSFEKWLDVIKTIRAAGRREILVYLAASFGSVLLPLLNILPFIVNLYGETGKGKTVALMVAASVWARPAQGGYIAESNSTNNALEKRLDILNHLPCMIDDLSKVRDREGERFTDFIYTLCAGAGKGRMNRNIELRDVSVWQNIILTNLERPLTDDGMRGGAVNRVLDFDIEGENIFDDGNAIVSTISENYGYAGALFVESVQQLDTAEIKKTVFGYEQQIKDEAKAAGAEKEAKQITPLAVLLTADELSERFIFKDGVRIDVRACIASLKNVAEVSEMGRAYKHLMEVVQMQYNKFAPSDDGTYRSEAWGCFPDVQTVAVIPAALEIIARQYNFSAPQFVRWCKVMDKLECEDGRNQKRVRLPGRDDYTRCYVFRRTETEETKGEFTPLPDDADLPFE